MTTPPRESRLSAPPSALHPLARALAAGVVLVVASPARAEIVEVPDGTGKDYFVIDAPPGGFGDDNYFEPGPFGGEDTGQVDSWNGDRRWGNDGEFTEATWSFDTLPDGTYSVYASWRNIPQNNVSIARYTGTDGFPETEIDQRIGAEGHPGIVLNDGLVDVNFALLGEVTIADGTFDLTVDDTPTGFEDATTFIFADAVALGPIPREDSDEDGMPDTFEDQFGLDKNDPDDAGLDREPDGLTNLEEYRRNTDPTKADTDGDTLSDGVEVNDTGTDPTNPDSDGDLLGDGVETGTGTFVGPEDTGSDPNDFDTDDDGIDDGTEVASGTDPNRPGAGRVTDAMGDTYLVLDNGLVSGVGTGQTFTPVDARNAYYEEPGAFTGQDGAGQPDSWNGDRRWGNDGELTEATWTFDGLATGTYDVYASWRNVPQGNVSLARYTVSDDGPTVELDQSIGAEGHPGIVLDDGVRLISFASIGQVEVADGDLTVTVDDSVTGSAEATTFIFADAIAIGPINDLGPVVPFAVTRIEFDRQVISVVITWNSKPGAFYAIDFSTDMATWLELDDGYASGGDTTTFTDDLASRFPLAELPPRGYYRVRAE